jgi:hypothetical protein
MLTKGDEQEYHASISIIAPDWKQPKCTSNVELIELLWWYSHKMEYQAAMRMHEPTAVLNLDESYKQCRVKEVREMYIHVIPFLQRINKAPLIYGARSWASGH